MMFRCTLFWVATFLCLLYCEVALAAAPSKDAKTECIPIKDDHSAFHCMTSHPPKIACANADNRCEKWASQGECANNPQYMLVQCRNACDSCVDLHSGVVQIAPDEDIREEILRKMTETQEYMHNEAVHNVIALKKCVNKHDLCTHWSVRGECSTNAGFMHSECSPACQTCDKVQ